MRETWMTDRGVAEAPIDCRRLVRVVDSFLFGNRDIRAGRRAALDRMDQDSDFEILPGAPRSFRRASGWSNSDRYMNINAR